MDGQFEYVLITLKLNILGDKSDAYTNISAYVECVVRSADGDLGSSEES